MNKKLLCADLLCLISKTGNNLEISQFSTCATLNVVHVSDRPHSTAAEAKTREDYDEPIRKTCLHDLHVAHSGKMVKFAGYYLPVQYGSFSIVSSHLHTRSSCSLFDVSHMLQTGITGKHCVEFLESLCVTDIRGMKNGQSALSLFTSAETGGILDDFIVTKVNENALYLVTNASRQHADKAMILDSLETYKENYKWENISVEFFDSDEKSLIAIQGPKSEALLQKLCRSVDLSKLYFMNSIETSIDCIPHCRITRCGYTGEDGFEISVSSDRVIQLVDSLLQMEEIKLAGLGARDSLRLEAGLCLYGNDINESTTPVEAGLSWTIGKRRREDKRFNGAEKILRQTVSTVVKRRIGIVQNGGPPGRGGCELLNPDNGETVGFLTSGIPSPSLGLNIAMGYVPPGHAKIGTNLLVRIRGSTFPAVVSKMPFVSAKYYVPTK